ncbi:zinc finger protein 862-like [Rhizophagus irregularis DAOM 181602=DAOM 197198]|nr:zinc finger protein 862-like [Rhizophagus irregularis DAOM 181602=DAOM 197198]
MSLLQYGFKRKKINRNDIFQEDQISEDEDNSNKDVKKLRINDKTFKSKWLAEFSWLRYDEINKKMYCTLCMRHKKKNKFATEGATNISRKSAIKEHINTEDHKDTEKLEKARIQMELLQKEHFSSNANTNHIIGIMRAVYFLAKKNLPLKLLPSIVELIKESNSPNLLNGTITYTNHISGHEFLEAISDTIKEEIWDELSNVTAFGVMIDESTDITTTKHLDIYASYVTKKGILKTRFLCIVPLTSCNAEGITKVLVDIFEKRKILSKLVAFASDGASVMLGKNEGVAAKFSRICTYPLIVNHCVAHRLALACKDAKKELRFYEEIESLVRKIYNYFKNSCSHIQQLQEIQSLLDDPILKIKKLYEIRWLAWYDAIKNICNSIPALLRIFKESKNKDGRELYERLTSWRILAFLYYFYDILEHVTQLSKFLQKRNLKFSDIDPMIQVTINSIQKEYILLDQNQRFGQKVQTFIDETNPFGNSSIKYMNNDLSFIEQDYDDFTIDILEYSTSIVNELQQRFPTRQLFTSMKILNPREWPKESQELLWFGDNELENILKYYECPNFHNNIQLPAIFDINKCREEWARFKMIITNNFASNDIEVILPLLIEDYIDVFPNIIKLIQIAYCIPFSSVECERGFSRQNKIKTKDRNSLATNTLDMLMCISLEGPESKEFNYNRAYTIWSNQKRRTGFK